MTATYERAHSGYDAAHARELVKAIGAAILATSKVSDADDLVVIRTGEIMSALLEVQAIVLALSPSTPRTRQARRALMLELGRRLQLRTAEAVADPNLRDFVARCFHGTDVRGNA